MSRNVKSKNAGKFTTFAETKQGFTLVELLTVISIIVIISTLALLAVPSLKGSRDLTRSATIVAGVLEQARSYAMANNTYAWVGFFEEDGSKTSSSPAQAGVGRIVMATVASTDGTMNYSLGAATPLYLDTTRLLQINKLIRIQNAHLISYTDGTGSDTTFAGRPPVASAKAHIGDSAPSSGALPFFQFPPGQPSAVQYSFSTVLQFSPRGEVLASNMAGIITPLIEVGLQATHGNIVDTSNLNSIALQISGISGNLIVYRK